MTTKIELPDVLTSYIDISNKLSGIDSWGSPESKALQRDLEEVVKTHVRSIDKAGFCTLAIPRDGFEEAYPDFEYPYRGKFGKIYKIYNAEDSGFYIKDTAVYGNYPVGKVYLDDVPYFKPVEAMDNEIKQQIEEYKALIREAEKKLEEKGIVMLSSDQETSIDWHSSSLDC